MTPVALRTSDDVAKALLTALSDSPLTPARREMVDCTEVRTDAGKKAVTTMTAGKRETKALAPRATLRSTNSFSSRRSQTRQKIVADAQSCNRPMISRPWATSRAGRDGAPLGTATACLVFIGRAPRWHRHWRGTGEPAAASSLRFELLQRGAEIA